MQYTSSNPILYGYDIKLYAERNAWPLVPSYSAKLCINAKDFDRHLISSIFAGL